MLVMVFAVRLRWLPSAGKLDATSLILPGHIIPAAREAHSTQAMLALIILIAWHIYGAHLAPEAFPMNKSIFTGYQTKEEFKRNHRLEYDRIFSAKNKK